MALTIKLVIGAGTTIGEVRKFVDYTRSLPADTQIGVEDINGMYDLEATYEDMQRKE